MRKVMFFVLLFIAYCDATETYAQSPTNGKVMGHEYVDLGLSVKWAACNIGAEKPSDYGNYYAWGETRKKSSYTDDNSATYGKDMSNISSKPIYDAACDNWGGTWRLPTKGEIDELINDCKHEWITQEGHNGYLVTGPNGNSIFLPAAGRINNSSLEKEETNGNYWSGTPSEELEDLFLFSYGLSFSSSYFKNFDVLNRFIGQSIRPVTE